jgi:signal recognition particle subunit SEC65
MKEYDRYVVWLNYFDSELKRNQGRRIPLSTATRAPKLAELGEACRRLNLQPEGQSARYPGTPSQESGFVVVTKSKPKGALLLRIAKELTVVRGLEQKRQERGGHRTKK